MRNVAVGTYSRTNRLRSRTKNAEKPFTTKLKSNKAVPQSLCMRRRGNFKDIVPFTNARALQLLLSKLLVNLMLERRLAKLVENINRLVLVMPNESGIYFSKSFWNISFAHVELPNFTRLNYSLK